MPRSATTYRPVARKLRESRGGAGSDAAAARDPSDVPASAPGPATAPETASNATSRSLFKGGSSHAVSEAIPRSRLMRDIGPRARPLLALLGAQDARLINSAHRPRQRGMISSRPLRPLGSQNRSRAGNRD